MGDDFSHALGDANEGRLAAALYYREHGTCPAASPLAQALTAEAPAVEGVAVKPPWREIRILKR